MPNNKDYSEMSPAELRKEADRRELVLRHRLEAERRAARIVIAEAIVALPASTVLTADAYHLLLNTLTKLAKDDADNPGVTNGDVSMATYGASQNWWQEAIADHPKPDPDNILERLRKGRVPLWRAQ